MAFKDLSVAPVSANHTKPYPCLLSQLKCRHTTGGGPQGSRLILLNSISEMRRIAMNIRPVLLPFLVFAPNMKAREKALKAFRTYKRVFGNQQSSDIIQGIALMVTGASN